jgi:phosphatidylserine decarboxylase
VPNLFARNERVVTLFDTANGPLAMVLVGATIVASIETTWAGTITPPTGAKVFTWNYPDTGDNQIKLKKGDEMGRFKLGSTVVACFGPDMLERFSEGFEPDAITRLGRPMATTKPD